MTDPVEIREGVLLEAERSRTPGTTFLTVVLILSLLSPIVLALAGLGWRLFRHFAGW